MDYRAEFYPLFDGQALFLPSIFSGYVNGISKEVSQHRPGFAPTRLYSTRELNFLDREYGMFFYPWALYSAGVANCPSSKQMGLLSVFHKGGSGSSLFDVKPLGFDGSSGGFGWSVF